MSYVRVVVSFSHSLCHSLLLINCHNYIAVFILVVIIMLLLMFITTITTIISITTITTITL